jgi:tRNA(Ile)-lysidine synthase
MPDLDARYLPAEGPLVAGVSGGADSLCLLDLLVRAGRQVLVAHLDHGLRPEAQADAERVAAQARARGLDCVVERQDVRAYAAGQGLSIEESARLLRYRFLFAAARRAGARAVVVGHTADDQVETVLMHFLRGAGLDGLKGMQPSTILPIFDAHIPLVRPLLHVWRHETEAYCREQGLVPSLDASNADPAYFRNRLRHVLIPELERYNPRFKEALLRSSLTLADDHALLQGQIDVVWGQALAEAGIGYLVFQADVLAQMPAGLRRSLLRRAATRLRPAERDFSFERIQAAAAFCSAGEAASGRLELGGGLSLFREGHMFILAAWEADLPAAHWPQLTRPLPLPTGSLNLGDWVLHCEAAVDLPAEPPPADNWSAWLDAGCLSGDLHVRPPRPGDRFQPLGLPNGSVKLSDFFINEKLPRRARQNWPLVCAGEQIVWVPGYRIAHPARVTPETRRIVKLHLGRT